MPSTTIVINEFAVANAAGSGAAPAADEYIELKNLSGQAIDLTGYKLVYRSASGTADVTLLTFAAGTSIAAGGYLLIGNSAGYTGPTADRTWTTGTTGTFSGTSGGIALRDAAGLIVDSVGYGTATNAFVETTPEPVHAAGQALHRGSQDTDNNLNDFSSAARGPQGAAVTPTLNISDVTMAEGTVAGTTTFTFNVTLTSAAGAGGVTFDIATADGTAQDDNPAAEDNDYVAQALTGQSIPASGTGPYQFSVTVNNDNIREGNETFFVNVTNIVGATAGDAQGQGTITDDDTPALSIDNVTLAEGNAGTTTFTFTVSLNQPAPAGGVTFSIATADGTATTADGDYVARSLTTQTIAEGQTSYTFDVTVNGDTAVENGEDFLVNVTDVVGATVADGQGTGTITNDDAPPAPAGNVSIADASIVEGNNGTSILTLTLTRSDGTAPFSVNYATSNGGNPNNASATAGSDYVASSGTVSFADGVNTATIDITINGDTTAELSEEFTVTLSNATNGATITDATAIGTITTDDAATSAVDAVWLNEINYDPPGTDSGEFIEIAGIAGTDLSEYSIVRYNGNGNAVYTTPAQTTVLTGLIPDQGGGYGTFTVFYPQDGLQNGAPDGIALARTVNSVTTLVEFVSYEGTMTGSGGVADGVLSTDIGVIQTQNANTAQRVGGPGSAWVLQAPTQGAINTGQTYPAGSPVGPTVSVSDVSVNEAAGTMTFTVTRSNLAAGAFSVDYSTADGTAVAPGDYVAGSGTLNFTDNQVQAIVTVAINDETTPELDETVLLNLSNATGATIVDGQGVGTIVNDDGAPIQVSINDVSIQEGNSGTSILTFTITRTGATGAFSVSFATSDGTATAGSDYVANSGTVNFLSGETTKTVEVIINGDMAAESNETFQVLLSAPTNDAVIADATGVGTILNDEATLISAIQGQAYYSPILATEGKTAFNVASTTVVTISAVVTAVDNDGDRQGYYLSEETSQWDTDSRTSEGIFVMTRNDAGVGVVVAGISVGDLVQISANVMEYQAFSTMPRTVLVNPTGLSIITTANPLPVMTLTNMPNEVMTGVTPDYTDSSDDAGDSFDASVYALSYFETVEGMLVTIPDMVVADGFVSVSNGDPYFQAYSLQSANADQINSRGGYTIAGDPPIGPPDTATPGDDTTNGGRVLHDGDVNPDIIELDFTGFAMAPPAGLTENATMGDPLGDVTGIIDFDFTDRKLFVTAMEPGGFVNTGRPVQEVTVLGDDTRSLTVGTFNVENLDPGDGAARFTAIANAIANNLNAPDIISIEEMQDNNGATATGGADASTTWQMLVNALNLATGANYQWVDQEPVAGAEGGEPGGNIRVGFLYNTDRVQLGNLDADATLAERRQYTDRIGDGVRDAGDLIAYSDNMLGGEINTADWSTTRRSLLAEFTFQGNTIYVTANHWPAKGGSGDFWQLNQNLAAGEPDNSDWAQRNEVGQDVYAMMNLIQTSAPGAGIVAGGDFNDFYFYRPLTTVTGYTLADGTARTGGARFDNLTLLLPEAERYTYTFDGRSQAIDHIIANNMLSTVATYDVVHLSTGYNSRGTGANANPQLSDHDPALASFDFRSFSEIITGTPQRDVFRLEQGGNDTVYGLEGNDTFYFGAAFDENDYVDGDGGVDSIILDGNYPGLVLGTDTGSNIVGIETISLVPAEFTDYDGSAAGSHSYNITTLDSNVAAGAILKVNGFYLGATENFTFDGTAENDGKFILLAGQGEDSLIGGAGNDVFVFGHDGRFGSGDEVAGLGGYDSVYLRGDYVIDFNAVGFTLALGGIESVTLGGAAETQFVSGGDGEFDYTIIWNNGLLDGGTITFNGSGLAAAESMGFDGSSETTASFRLFGGAGDDVLRGGGGNDLIYGGLGQDTQTGGGGNDIFRYHSVDDSTAVVTEGIGDFNTGDRIDLSVIDARPGTPGNDAFDFIGDAAFTLGQPGQVRAQAFAGNIWVVQADIDGNAFPDFQIYVTNLDGHTFTSADFIL